MKSFPVLLALSLALLATASTARAAGAQAQAPAPAPAAQNGGPAAPGAYSDSDLTVMVKQLAGALEENTQLAEAVTLHGVTLARGSDCDPSAAGKAGKNSKSQRHCTQARNARLSDRNQKGAGGRGATRLAKTIDFTTGVETSGD